MRLEHVTRTPTNGSAELMSRITFCIMWPVYCTAIGESSGHVIRTYIQHIYVLYIFDTVLCQFLETGTSDRTLICLNQLLRFLGFSLYPLSFFLYSPFNSKFIYLKTKLNKILWIELYTLSLNISYHNILMEGELFPAIF